ncbi:BESS motif [Popillia japonica]|uniref:BESS motif n=1 Tax=Popillia japonica TaxID=7064 RepID=A0AAW1N8E2_POPJA
MAEAIIQCVYMREEIWNPHHRHHKHVYILKKKWLEVAQELGKEVKEVKRKWKYLRDYFVKERKKVIAAKSAENVEDICSWPYYNLLHFLNDVVLSDTSDTKAAPDIQETVKSEITDIDIEQSTLFIKLNTQSSDHSCRNNISSQLELINAKIAKFENLNENSSVALEDISSQLELINAKIAKFENLNENSLDEDLMFFKSLLADIKLLPKQRKRRLKLKIQELVVREVEASEEAASITST